MILYNSIVTMRKKTIIGSNWRRWRYKWTQLVGQCNHHHHNTQLWKQEPARICDLPMLIEPPQIILATKQAAGTRNYHHHHHNVHVWWSGATWLVQVGPDPMTGVGHIFWFSESERKLILCFFVWTVKFWLLQRQKNAVVRVWMIKKIYKNGEIIYLQL